MNQPQPDNSRKLAEFFAGTRFLKSAAAPRDFPPPEQPEICFAGRSNAGKSSALNALTGRKGLARVSKTPGRTQLINFFDVMHGESLCGRLVDLPGYGFAQVPLPVKRDWSRLIEDYLQQRDSLRGIVLVMDARHPLTDFDRQMLDWAATYDLSCHLLLTKSDKLSRSAAMQTLHEVGAAVSSENLSTQLFSAPAGTGIDEARQHLAGWLKKTR